ncbi:MAG: type II toxin-antitoxin system HicB family antitoxin [Bacillota bacterium]|jgi:predicted RNase H-like HicB family nuclease
MSQFPNRLHNLLRGEYNIADNSSFETQNSYSMTATITITTTTTQATAPFEGRGKGMGVISAYIQRALRKAQFEQFDDGSYYAEIPECPGVWANEESREQCETVLSEALEDWILLKLQDGDPLPEIDGIRLRMEKPSWTP